MLSVGSIVKSEKWTVLPTGWLLAVLVYGCNTDEKLTLPVEARKITAKVTNKIQTVKSSQTNAEVLKFVATGGDLCKDLPTHKNAVLVPKFDKMPVAKAFKDPAFGVHTIRISDTKKGEVVKPMYSTIQSWNADESRLILYHTGGKEGSTGHHLYDGKTYKHIKKLDITAKDIEEVYWHHSDPDTLFYVSAYFKYYGQFIRYNIKTGKKIKIASFERFCGRDGLPVSGNDVMMPSWDDDVFGFRCNDGQGQDTGFSYRISSGKVQSVSMGEGTNYQAWYAPTPTASGTRYRLNGYILNRELNKVEHQLDLAEFHSHSSLGRLANGHDALFATAFDPAPGGCDGGKDLGVGSLLVHDLEDKTCRVIISESKGYRYPGSGTHVSSVAHKNPGWVLLSTIGYGQFDFFSNDKPAPVLFSEMYLVNTDPENPRFCRVGHHRSFGKDAVKIDYINYLGEPHATLSPSGTRLVFGSDWYNSGSVDAYVVELPAYQE